MIIFPQVLYVAVEALFVRNDPCSNPKSKVSELAAATMNTKWQVLLTDDQPVVHADLAQLSARCTPQPKANLGDSEVQNKAAAAKNSNSDQAGTNILFRLVILWLHINHRDHYFFVCKLPIF
jgi:hypothetical protein